MKAACGLWSGGISQPSEISLMGSILLVLKLSRKALGSFSSVQVEGVWFNAWLHGLSSAELLLNLIFSLQHQTNSDSVKTLICDELCEVYLFMGKTRDDSEKEFMCLDSAELARASNWTEVLFEHALLLPWILAETQCFIGVIPELPQKEGILRAQCAYLQRNMGTCSLKSLLGHAAHMWSTAVMHIGNSVGLGWHVQLKQKRICCREDEKIPFRLRPWDLSCDARWSSMKFILQSGFHWPQW